MPAATIRSRSRRRCGWSISCARRKRHATKPARRDAARATRPRARDPGSPALPCSGAETLFFFAAQPGQVSFDGAGQNSFYVEGLKEELSKPGRPLDRDVPQCQRLCAHRHQGRQIPQVVSDWTADIVLGKPPQPGHIRSSPTPDSDLTKAERDLVLRSASGFGKFDGDFIAKAGIGDCRAAT